MPQTSSTPARETAAPDRPAASRPPGPRAPARSWSALVLAGRRAEGDPLAEAAGVSHKALLPLAGAPMVVRVVRALLSVERLESIAVSIDRPEVLEALPGLQRPPESVAIAVHASRESPAASVQHFLASRPEGETVLVTTADHPLLSPTALRHFVDAADRLPAADAVVGVVTESTLRRGDRAGPPGGGRKAARTAPPGPARPTPEAASPEPPALASSRRTLFPLRGERIAGANLFALRGDGGRRAAAFWRRAERLRKRPWRLVSLLGPAPLALLALRRLDLEGALARASARMGARLAAVRLPFAECAVDVDRPEDLELVRRVLEGAGAEAPASSSPAATPDGPGPSPKRGDAPR